MPEALTYMHCRNDTGTLAAPLPCLSTRENLN